jgi:tRNA (cytidine/uridine-2'-O-)-methyltransferase
MRIALFQPDIAPNVGAVLRLGACLGVPVDIIEPCGFVLGSAGVRRAGMDYIELATLARHRSWQGFLEARAAEETPGRLVLLTTKGDECYHRFRFAPDDTLLAGRESAGVPDEVHEAADARLRIPMSAKARSLNLVSALALALGEALRQTERFPGDEAPKMKP